MADSVDDRVVSMKFDNATFQANIQDTLVSLGKLQKSLDLTNATKGFQNLNVEGANDSLNRMASSVSNIESKFSALGVTAFAVISNLTNRVVDAGLSFAKQFTMGPVLAGFGEMETKVGSIQTILANTAKFGTTLPQVTASLDELNKYSDKTIYDFGEMTKNIGLFTNAGIRIEDATSMIEGFSNAAAASGTTAEGAAGAAYQLSQALSNGTIKLMDWRSLTNVGMGNKNMQQGVLEIAKAMGTLDQTGTSAEEVQAHFNETLEKGWLTSDVMSTYLKIMAGDMDDAKLKALGLSDAMIANFKEQQKTAEDAATKIRTWSQLVNTIKESIGSGWTDTFELLIGDFEGATSLFTAINNAVGGFVGRISDARNELLQVWSDMNGRGTLIEGITRIFQALGEILNGVKYAFRNLFPATTAEDLLHWTASFSDFSFAVKELVDRILPKLVYMFGLVFSVIKIGVTIVKGITGLFVDLFQALIPDRSGTKAIGLFGNLARVLYTLNVALINEGITKFFDYLGKVLVPIARLIGNTAGAIIDFFGAFKFSGVVGTFLKLLDSAKGAIGEFAYSFTTGFSVDEGTPIEKFALKVRALLFDVRDAMATVAGAAQEFYGIMFHRDFKGIGPWEEDSKIVGILFSIRDAFAHVINTIRGIDFGAVLGKVGAGFGALKDILVGLFSFGGDTDKMDKASDSVKKFSDAYEIMYASVTSKDLGGASLNLESFSDRTKNSFSGIGEFFQRIGDYIGAFIDTVQMYTGKIHEAMGKLGDSITKFFTGQEVVSTQTTFQKIVDVINAVLFTGILYNLFRFFSEFKKLVKTADGIFSDLKDALNKFGKETKTTALIKIGIALALLAEALKKVAGIPREDLAGAFAAMAAGLAEMMVAIKVMDKTVKDGGDLKQAAGSMILMAAALRILAEAVKVFGEMDIEVLRQGLIGAGLGLAGLAAAASLIQTSVKPGTALVVLGLAGAMLIIGEAVGLFAKFNPAELAKGIISMSVALLAIGVAVGQMGPASILAAPAILIVALTMGKIADAIKEFAAIKTGDLIKGILGIGFALDMITGTVRRLGPEAILGAASIAIVAISLGKIVDAVQDLGTMKGSELRQGLIAMAAGLAAIALATNAMEEALPGAAAMLVVSAAISVLVDAIVKLGSADLKTIGVGIGALVVSFLLLAAAGAFLSLPLLALGAAMVVLGTGFLLFGAGVWLVVKAFEVLVDVANKNTNIVIAILNKLAVEVPKSIVLFVESLADGAGEIAKSAKKISDAFAKIVIDAIDAIIRVIPKVAQLVDAITGAILEFLGNRLVDFIDMGYKIFLALGQGFMNNVGEIVDMAVEIFARFSKAIADNMPTIIDSGVRIIKAFIYGLGARVNEIVAAGTTVALQFLWGLASNAVLFANEAANILVAFLNGMADAIRTHSDEIHQAAVNIATAIIEGLAVALVGKDNVDKVINAIKSLGGTVIDTFMHAIHASSPSKDFVRIGGYIVQGLANGIDDDSVATNSAVQSAERIVEAFSKTLGNMPDALQGMDEFNPTITPVLDLSRVAADARGLNAMIGSPTISPVVSTAQARLISTTSELEHTPSDDAGGGATNLTFIQNNNSPKALSTNDLYRQTQSQLAIAKEKLGIS